MAEFMKVAATADVPPGQGKIVEAQGKVLALFNVEGRFYAIDNTCRHRGGPLGEGELDGSIVSCPWHGWRWDVTTGANAMNPAIAVSCFLVRVEEGSVFVQV